MVNRRSPRTPKLTNINSGGKSLSEQLNKSSGRKCAVRINRDSAIKLLEKQSKDLLDLNRNSSKKNLFQLDRNKTKKAELNVENDGMSTPLRRVTRKTAKLSLKSPEIRNDESTPVKDTIDTTKFAKLSLRSAKKNEIPSTPNTSETAQAQETKDTKSELIQVEENALSLTPTTTPTARVTRRKFRAVGNTPRPADKQVEENVSVKEDLRPATRKRGKVDENAPTPAKKKKSEVSNENQGLLSKSSENEENLDTPIKESVKRVTRSQGVLSVKTNESTPVRKITRKSVKSKENESASTKEGERNKFEEDLKIQEIESSPIKSTVTSDTSKNLSDKEIEDILMEIDESVNKENGEAENVPSFKKPSKKETKILSSSLKSSSKKPETIEDDIYELEFSQPSASEAEDMTLFEKLAKEGKVQIKHKRKKNKPQKTGKKKRYLDTSRTWHKIERNIGISPKKLNLMKSKKNADDVKSMATNLNKDSNLLNEKEQIEHVALIHNEPIVPATINQSSLEQTEDIPNISINTSLPSTSSTSSPLLPRNVQNLRNKPQVTDKNKLLEFAKSFVSQSTPIVKKQSANTGNSAAPLSPILPSSPWRKTTSINPNDTSHIDSFLSVDFNDSIIKNSSNAENIPPVSQQQQQKNQTIKSSTTTTTENKLTSILSTKQNTGISTSQQFSKVIGKRNPLKEINILEVVNLPPLPLRARRIDELSSVLNKSKLGEITEDIIQTDDDCNKKKLTEKDTTANYFGFDEIEEIEESNDADKANDTTIIPQKSHLKRKLQKLQKLLPPVQRNLRNKSPVKKLPLFGETTSKQPKLHEMLSSTMVNSSSVPATDDGDNDENVKNDEIESADDYELNESAIPKDTNDTVVTVDLFEELHGPETTLDSTKIKKTYSRQKKKPRRYFTFFSENETDSEPEDEQGEGKNKKRKKQRKKPDKPQYNEVELDKFAEEFNSMCEEAENYVLVKETESSTLNV